ncbi:trypsin-2 [Drosophila busckii]|uniref:trypsin-2 n=1 Tax=Drosophila busckii TaxID=30019 RepID=UPI00083F3E3D|nr:trypsin-2 [Drosophila busckii]
MFKEFSRLLLIMLCSAHLVYATNSQRDKRLATPYFNEDTISKIDKYVVSIRSRTPFEYYGDNHFCAGTIVSELFVLTAAHCVMDKHSILYRARLLLIVAGTPNRLKFVRNQSINIPAKQTFVQENFTRFNTNNIALILLSIRLPTDDKLVGFIQLPSGPPTPGQMYEVVGWGRLYKGGILASKALFITVKLQNSTVCEEFIPKDWPGTLCAGNLDSDLDEHPCQGDSGDPLMSNGTIYGLVTHGLGCGKKHFASIYTDVYYNIDWINEIMLINCSNNLLTCWLPLYALLIKFCVMFNFVFW